MIVSLFRPIVFYGQRYLIIAAIPFYALVALGFTELRRRFGRAPWMIVFITVIAGMVYYQIDYFNSRQKRAFDTAATEFLDRQFRAGDALVVFPAHTAGVVEYYLDSPYRVLPHRLAEIQAALNSDPDITVWFIDIEPTRPRLEVEATRGAALGQTVMLKIGDIPGKVLCLRPYRAIPPRD